MCEEEKEIYKWLTEILRDAEKIGKLEKMVRLKFLVGRFLYLRKDDGLRSAVEQTMERVGWADDFIKEFKDQTKIIKLDDVKKDFTILLND